MPKLFIRVNKKQIKALAKRYEDVYNVVLNGYPAWRRNAVVEDLTLKRNSGFVQEFVKSVIAQTESQELDLNVQSVVTRKKVVSNAAAVNKKV
jgi:hypothetical protein